MLAHTSGQACPPVTGPAGPAGYVAADLRSTTSQKAHIPVRVAHLGVHSSRCPGQSPGGPSSRSMPGRATAQGQNQVRFLPGAPAAVSDLIRGASSALGSCPILGAEWERRGSVRRRQMR